MLEHQRPPGIGDPSARVCPVRRRRSVNRKRPALEPLEGRALLAPLVLNLDVPKLSQPVYASLYTQLLQPYTSGGTTIPKDTYVYLKSDETYAKTLGLATKLVPSFTTFAAESSGHVSITLPDVNVNSARLYFGINAPVQIPVIQDANGSLTAPAPINSSKQTYDFVEFTLDNTGDNNGRKLTINTSTIDQLGFPITVNVTPKDPALPDGVGVTPARVSVFSDYTTFLQGRSQEDQAAFLQTARDGFGNPLTTRILSPKDEEKVNPVQGVVAALDTPAGNLPDGTYYYAVTAVDASGHESKAGNLITRFTKSGGQSSAVKLAWQFYSGASKFKVYRGSISGSKVTWALAGETTAPTDPKVGPVYFDAGKAHDTAATPPFDPLNTYFDTAIQTLFEKYTSTPLTLIATGGAGDPNKPSIYTFDGQTITFNAADPNAPKAPAGVPDGNKAIEFVLKSNTLNGQPVANPTIPLGTKLYVYYPYFNTNTYNPTLPAPPSWLQDPAIAKANETASGYAFAGEGTFADNSVQPSPVQDPAKTAVFRVLLGSLENQIVAAVNRGVATSLDPSNWASGPRQLPPTLVTGGNLGAGTYVYVITAVGAKGESTASIEYGATTDGKQAVKVNWTALSTSAANAFRIYRGTKPGGENQLIGTVTNTGKEDSFTDYGAAAPAQPTGTLQAGGTLTASTKYYYFVSAVDAKGESTSSPEMALTTTATEKTIELQWAKVDVSKATSFKIYRGTKPGGEDVLIGTVANTGVANTFKDGNSTPGKASTPPVYYAAGVASNLYSAFLHLPTISKYGLAYGLSYDDQGNFSSTITTQPASAGAGISTEIALGPWTLSAVLPSPTVASVTPATGNTAGGTQVVITGTDLAGASAVYFGTAAATGVSVNADGTQITATSPQGQVGKVHITVATPGGTSATSASDQFTYFTPTASIVGAPDTTAEASPINLSSLIDNPLPILTYSWVASLNGTTVASGTSADFSFTPHKIGSYLVSLIVSDSHGNRSTASTTILGTAVSPTASILGPSAGGAGKALDFTLQATHPSATVSAAGFTYVIDWGDGSAVQTVAATPGNGAGVAVSHAFKTTGNFMVQVTATNEEGSSSPSVTQSVKIRVASTAQLPDLPASLLVNQPLVLQSVVVTSDRRVPKGTVKFLVDGKVVGKPVSLVDGKATLQLAGLAAGRHTITVSYGGNANIALSSVTKAVKVGYAFRFIRPDNPTPRVGIRLVQLRVADFSGQAAGVATVHSFAIAPVLPNGTVGSPVVQTRGTGSLLKLLNGQLEYRWNTRDVPPGRYRVTVSLADGTIQSQSIVLR